MAQQTHTSEDIRVLDLRPLASVHPLVDGATGHRRVRVVVISEQDVIQRAMRTQLGALPWMARCLAARTAEEGIRLSHRYEPHVAIVAPRVAGESGLELATRLRQLSPAPRVLFLTGRPPISTAAARMVGARGVVEPGWRMHEIALAVRMIASGHDLVAPTDTVGLSNREREVMVELQTGATNSQIAQRLGLSPHTVKDHVSSIYRKLGVRNRAEALQRSQHLGLTG